MGLLDELRAQSELQRAKEEDVQESKDQQELLFKKQVRPRFRALYNYLLELVEHLNYLKADIKVSYNLPGSKESHELHQRDYSITVDSSDNLTQFIIRCKVVGARPIHVRLDDGQSPEKFINHLRQFSLIGVLRTMGARSAHAGNLIEITQEIPISLTFQMDTEMAAITISTMNFPALGKIKKTFPADEINEQWMEDVGDMLVRKKDIITTLPISEKERQRIKATIKEHSREKDNDWQWYSDFKKDPRS